MPTDCNADFIFETVEIAPTDFVDHDEVELDDEPAHVITMLHGIRDNGIWALDLQYHSRKNGLKVVIQPVSYGWLGAFPFLLRIGATSIESRVLSEMKRILDRYPASTHSVLAHSNGTKIISRIARRLPKRYRHAFFCGSVCKRDDAPELSPSPNATVVNDCSPRDIWPIMAQIINPWHYEATGTYGFRRSGVEDRFFTVSHGGCLTAHHFEYFILPMILRNSLPFGEKPRSLIPYSIPTYARLIAAVVAACCTIFFM